MMHLDAFDYDLPEHLIAQEPAARRDHSRLLVLHRPRQDRAAAVLLHRVFTDLPELLAPGDLVILNDTRVIAARLVGRRARTEGKWEGLFVREEANGTWELMLQTRGHLLMGETLLVESPAASEEELRLVLVAKTPAGRWLVRPGLAGPAAPILARFGQVPIPPYIRKGRAVAADSQRYQTIYARRDGAVAAPTAGLHFTQEGFAALEKRGIERAFVTLHVGPGTFQPVKVEDVTQHRVEPEWGEVPAATVAAIARCKQRGGKVVAAGTTTVRVLENAPCPLAPWSGLCELTIRPPFSFRVVDALITNFHLPRSSLLLLVAAFAELDTIRSAYAEAIAQQYRFYSYGDAMLIV
jgi:S-adenosylmethionine:tRNA ribosyltransferase-isomerase